MEFVELPLSMVGLDPRPERQIRPIDMDYCGDLEAVSDPSKWDPIEVRPWPESDPMPEGEHPIYQVISGYHRTTVARRLRLATIRATILGDVVTDLEFHDRALQGNLRHGKRMSTDELRAAALRYKSLGLSRSQIAERMNSTPGTVYNWLSGRDTNKSRPLRTQQPSEDKGDAYASDLPNDWQPSPIPLDAERLRAVELAISDFLATTPTHLETRDVATWAASLPPLTAGSIADDLDVTLTWLGTLRQVLGKSNAERTAELKAKRKAERKAGAA